MFSRRHLKFFDNFSLSLSLTTSHRVFLSPLELCYLNQTPEFFISTTPDLASTNIVAFDIRDEWHQVVDCHPARLVTLVNKGGDLLSAAAQGQVDDKVKLVVGIQRWSSDCHRSCWPCPQIRPHTATLLASTKDSTKQNSKQIC